MAVCNLFGELTNPSGNFLMFSRYADDLIANITDGDNWTVVPSKFMALNINYSNVLGGSNLNAALPEYFQNEFENSWAHYLANNKDVTPTTFTSLFWSKLGAANMLNEVVYVGDINMHAYNTHKGMGYGEIYCYIPTDAGKISANIDVIDSGNVINNENTTLEGYDIPIGDNYSKTYSVDNDYTFSFEHNNAVNSFDINTIIVFYSIQAKVNNKWEVLYEDIPLGLYLTGMFDGPNLTNKVTKFVSTSYGTGTSYGLRICTRFSASTNTSNIAKFMDADVIEDYSGANICQLMSGMNENLTEMLNIVKSANDTTQQYKETLAAIKNNRTNVPYIKTVGGEDYWFVNGRMISKVNVTVINNITGDINAGGNGDNCCDTDNDGDCDCLENAMATDEEVAGALFNDTGDF